MDPFLIETNLPGQHAFAHPPRGFSPLEATPELLAAYGFPPRPSDNHDRARVARWKAAVTSERVIPELRITDVRHGPMVSRDVAAGTSPNWSGAVITDPGNSWAGGGTIWADFSVPGVTPPNTAPTSYCSIWVGIDGDGSSDVLQTGIQMVYGASGLQVYFWTEWFPANEIQVTNLGVSAGDSISLILSSAGVGGNAQLNSAYLYNANTNQHAAPVIYAPAGTRLVGNCIEWIVERPGVNNQLSTLAPYNALVMDDCTAQFGGPVFGVGSPPHGSLDFINMAQGSRTFSQASLGPPTQTPGGGQSLQSIAFVFNRY